MLGVHCGPFPLQIAHALLFKKIWKIEVSATVDDGIGSHSLLHSQFLLIVAF
jgi:hypothetical protein